MSCCGQRRMAAMGSLAHRPTGMASTTPGVSPVARPMARPLRLIYECVSATVLTSQRTGRRYRFDRPGARLEVDTRDQAMADARLELRRVR